MQAHDDVQAEMRVAQAELQDARENQTSPGSTTVMPSIC